MVNRYTKGRAKEQLVKTKLQAMGYYVTRSASSKGHFDLIAVKPDEKPLLIQVKSFSCSLEKVSKSTLISLYNEWLETPPFIYCIKVFVIITKDGVKLSWNCFFMSHAGNNNNNPDLPYFIVESKHSFFD